MARGNKRRTNTTTGVTKQPKMETQSLNTLNRQVYTQLQDENGKVYQIGKLIKSGGAGSVSHIDNTKNQVSKVYHDKIDKAYYLKKITAMQTLKPALAPVTVNGTPIIQLAWPEARLYDSKKQFVGFVMPELDVKNTIELEYILQERQAKAYGLPTGMGAKVSLAYNLCTLIEALHQQGHRIIDMKPLNLRFYKTSLYMSLLDCDGFSIQGSDERYPAGQFTVEYLAPEFQSKQTVPESQEEWQDRFALAVIIFQLLNFGLHPFSGSPKNDTVPTDIPRRIGGNFYAYGVKAHPLIAPSMVSGHTYLPDALRQLFDKAFSGIPSQRPSAKAWSDALCEYAQPEKKQLLVCEKNKQHQHFLGKPCAACARENQLQQIAKAQQQNKVQIEFERQKRAFKANANVIQAQQNTVNVTAAVQQWQSNSSFVAFKNAINKLPSLLSYTLWAVLAPIILGSLMALFVPTSVSNENGFNWVNSLFKMDYIQQWFITFLSIFILAIVVVVLFLMFIYPPMLIFKRKP